MPQTYYIDNGGAIDYNFDFTRNDVKIFMGTNFALNTVHRVGQIKRFVL
jgi:hypothetical protein